MFHLCAFMTLVQGAKLDLWGCFFTRKLVSNLLFEVKRKSLHFHHNSYGLITRHHSLHIDTKWHFYISHHYRTNIIFHLRSHIIDSTKDVNTVLHLYSQFIILMIISVVMNRIMNYWRDLYISLTLKVIIMHFYCLVNICFSRSFLSYQENQWNCSRQVPESESNANSWPHGVSVAHWP